MCVLCILTVIILWTLRLRGVRRKGFRLGFLAGKENRTAYLNRGLNIRAFQPCRSGSPSQKIFSRRTKRISDVIPTNKDSDHQVESAAQTPGPNSLEAAGGEYVAVSCEIPQSRSITPSNEPYAARDKTQSYNFQNANSEVTYAELSIARPSSLGTCRNGVSRSEHSKNRDDPTIYAQIDHEKKAHPQKTSLMSPLVSPVSSLFPVTKPTFHQREVITIRTPLMGHQQESCV
ncbi:hypothetical protein HHI36_000388 [Cryptolaemus montrouzieri]|uniref:Uncharacterized protein n=1 Tax=Cryptolaemus montrouzieri TaxID=559131 RepID=A0ABD2P4G3_9CUCU